MKKLAIVLLLFSLTMSFAQTGSKQLELDKPTKVKVHAVSYTVDSRKELEAIDWNSIKSLFEYNKDTEIIEMTFSSDFKKSKKKVVKKLIYEDEDIHETDIDGFLQKAINEKEYRLAIRYYYLSVLKILSDKKLIDYHKDKTNSEYLLEIENSQTRTDFSYLSYVYSYVWYGDFPINETNFKLVENKYQSFKKALK